MAGQGLALAEHGARHRVEAVVVHPDEGAAQEEDAVEDDASGNRRLPRAARPDLSPEAEGPGPPAQLERHAVPEGEPIEHGQVEIHHVPAGEHVGVQLAHAGAEGRQQVPLGREGACPVRAPAARRRQQEHLRGAAPVKADGEKAARRGIGLDVERENGEPRRPVGGEDLGILEHDAETRHLAALAVDLEGTPDAAVDQVAHGEADVGLVGRDAGLRQAVAQRGSIRGLLHLDAHDRPPEQGDLVGGLLPQRAFLPRALGVDSLDVEAGNPPAVAHEERAPVLEPPEEVQDGDARLDAIRRLQDEPAEGGHGRTCRPAAGGKLSLAPPRRFPRVTPSGAPRHSRDDRHHGDEGGVGSRGRVPERRCRAMASRP